MGIIEYLCRLGHYPLTVRRVDATLCSARTRLSADAKSVASGGQRQFSGLLDVYKKTLASDGIVGLYRGFVPSVVGICVYRGF